MFFLTKPADGLLPLMVTLPNFTFEPRAPLVRTTTYWPLVPVRELVPCFVMISR
jgi:hypothetical protein